MRTCTLVLPMILAMLLPRVVLGQDDPDIKVIESYIYGTLDVEAKEAAVKKLLDEKPRLANAKIDGQPILAWAADNISVEGSLGVHSRKLAEMVVAKGADVNARDGSGNVLLIRYAMFGRPDQIEFLCAHGANVGVKDSDFGRTPLAHVALLPESEMPSELVAKAIRSMEILLKAKADIEAKDKNGQTPIFHTAFLGNLRMTEFLLSKGADVNAVDKDGYSPLGLVLMRQKETWATDQEKAHLPPVIEILKKNGAKDLRPPE